MATTLRGPALAAGPDTRWRTRDIVIAAVIGVAFGVVFWVWGLWWSGPIEALFSVAPPLKDLGYAVWLVPAVLAPLIVRKPGAALFAEMVAAGVSAILGSQWGVDTLLSGFVQVRPPSWCSRSRSTARGRTRSCYRRRRQCRGGLDPRLGDLVPDRRATVQLVRGALMAISAIVVVAGGQWCSIERSRAGRPRGVPD
jgi:energy-coupling factor transport system substrate-specific component